MEKTEPKYLKKTKNNIFFGRNKKRNIRVLCIRRNGLKIGNVGLAAGLQEKLTAKGSLMDKGGSFILSYRMKRLVRGKD